MSLETSNLKGSRHISDRYSWGFFLLKSAWRKTTTGNWSFQGEAQGRFYLYSTPALSPTPTPHPLCLLCLVSLGSHGGCDPESWLAQTEESWSNRGKLATFVVTQTEQLIDRSCAFYSLQIDTLSLSACWPSWTAEQFGGQRKQKKRLCKNRNQHWIISLLTQKVTI